MPSAGRILYVLGLLCMLACIIDVLFVYFARTELTGYPNAHIILGGLGIILINVARFWPRTADDEEEE